jgi:hypothetical protein
MILLADSKTNIQACFHDYIAACKDNIFDDGTDVIMERLTQAAESIGETLDEAMGKLAQKVCLSSLNLSP